MLQCEGTVGRPQTSSDSVFQVRAWNTANPTHTPHSHKGTMKGVHGHSITMQFVDYKIAAQVQGYLLPHCSLVLHHALPDMLIQHCHKLDFPYGETGAFAP